MRTYSFALGNFKCTILEEARQDVDLFKEFPQIERNVLYEAINEVNYPSHMITAGFNYLLLKSNHQVILVDTGRGTNPFFTSLEASGVSPEDVDTIIITHGDGDHVGGIKYFKNANIILPRISHNLWTSEDGLETLMREFKDTMRKIVKPERLEMALAGRLKFAKEILPSLAKEKRINLVELGEEILPGIKFLEARGHRSDHFALEIQSGNKKLIHLSDAMRNRIQLLHGHWPAVYDSYPAQFSNSLEVLLKQDNSGELYFFATHLSFPGLLRKNDDGYLNLK